MAMAVFAGAIAVAAVRGGLAVVDRRVMVAIGSGGGDVFRNFAKLCGVITSASLHATLTISIFDSQLNHY